MKSRLLIDHLVGAAGAAGTAMSSGSTACGSGP
jgi:hypothetical protein